MAFLPPAVSRRIPRLFQRATQPPYLRTGDLWSHTDGVGVDYYDGSVLKTLGFGSASGTAYAAAAYHYGSATWADAIRAAYVACRAAGGGRVVLPAGLTLALDQAGHEAVIEHLADGVGAWVAPTIGRIVIDLNGSTVVLGANTRRLVDAKRTTNYEWFRNLEICNGQIDAGGAAAVSASIDHVLFGNCDAGFLARMNFERLYFHDLVGYNAFTNVGVGTAKRFWIGLAPLCLLNDTNPIWMRDISLERCRFDGGNCGLFVCATAGAAPVLSTDFFDATIERLYVDTFYHDSGIVPSAFTTGGAQVGGYALFKNSTIRNWHSKGAGDAGFETDNCHNILMDGCTIEDAYNSEFLVSSFGAKDPEQGEQSITYRNCTARHRGGGTPTNLGGFLVYTILGHRLGTITYDGCRYEGNKVPLNPGTGIDGLGVKAFAGTLTANANAADTTIQLANAPYLIVGYEIQLGGTTSGEWVTVTGITDGTHATVTALANSHLSGASVTQPCPIEMLDVDIQSRVTTSSYTDSGGGIWYSGYVDVQQCVVRIRRFLTRVVAATAGGAGALDYYGLQVSGRAIELDIEALDARADITYAGTQGNFRALALGHRNTIRPSTIKGVVKRLVPRPGSGFPAANQTGLYIYDRNQLVIDPGLLRVKDADFGNMALGAKEVTWQTALENLLPVLLDASNRPRSHTTWPQTYEVVADFADGAAGTSLSIDDAGWYSTDTNTGGTTTRVATQGRPGVQRADSGATAGNVRHLSLNNFGILYFSDPFDLYWWFAINQTDSLARLGMAVAFNVTQPTSGLYLEKLDTGTPPIGTNWYFVTRNAGTQTATDSGVAVATGWHQLRIRQYKDKGTLTVGFTLDSGAEVLQTTNLPSSGAFVPGWHVGNGANAASRTLDVDLMRLRVPNMVR